MSGIRFIPHVFSLTSFFGIFSFVIISNPYFWMKLLDKFCSLLLDFCVFFFFRPSVCRTNCVLVRDVESPPQECVNTDDEELTEDEIVSDVNRPSSTKSKRTTRCAFTQYVYFVIMYIYSGRPLVLHFWTVCQNYRRKPLLFFFIRKWFNFAHLFFAGYQKLHAFYVMYSNDQRQESV